MNRSEFIERDELSKKNPKSANHPELQTGEIWLSNIHPDDFKDYGVLYATGRKGDQAFDCDGQVIPALIPFFVNFVEYVELQIDNGFDI